MAEKRLLTCVRQRVCRCKARTFVVGDFADFAANNRYDQVLRALRMLIAAGELVRIGRGMYAKTKKQPNGAVSLSAPLPELAKEGLSKLGIKTGESKAWRDYNEGRSTQLPNGRVIAVDRRVRRKINYNGYALSFERMAGTHNGTLKA